MQADYVTKSKLGAKDTSRSVSPKRRSFVMNVWQTKSLTETLKKIAKLRERIFGQDSKISVRRNTTSTMRDKLKMSDS